MKGGKVPLKLISKQLGYTIVEVMIVLAVSGLMFLMAVIFINGKQQTAAFKQSTNEMTSRIQKIANDVMDGQYSDVPLECSLSASQVSATYNSGNSQGTNSDCVFLGKITHFYKASSGQPVQKFEVLSMADKRSVNNTTLPRDTIGWIEDLTDKQSISQGLEVKSMDVVDGTNVSHLDVYNIGFMQSGGDLDTGSTGYKSGAQTINLVFSGTMTGDNISSSTDFGENIKYAKSAKICLTDGTRYAQILIGGDSDSMLNVRTKQLGETAC